MSQNHLQKNMSFLDIIWRFKFQLLVYIFVISFVSFLALYMVGGIPKELRLSDDTPVTEPARTILNETEQPVVRPELSTLLRPASGTVVAGQAKGELPSRVIIDKIGVNTSVHNPSSTNVSVLNNELLKGAVRYPGSGTLGQGNMFIFGHSSSLKIVNNKAFKAFNNAKDLNIGDTIRVMSTTKEYTYKVTSVSLVESDKQFIDLKTDKTMLTITTCNVLGEKEERFVVEAIFVRSTAL